MKLKFKLTWLMSSIIALIVLGIALLLFNQASKISIDLNLRSIKNLSAQRAEFWKGREEGYLRVLHTLANIMSTYKDLPPELRRSCFSDELQGIINSELNMTALYTIWKPNALDGMDEHYIGKTGSGPQGQFAMMFSRESGEIIRRASNDIEGTMAYLNGSNPTLERVEHPVPRIVNGENSFVIRMMVPIVDAKTSDVVGGVGCLLNVAFIQPILEKTIKDHEEIAVMAIYSGNGAIIGHFLKDRIGKNLIDADKEYGKNIELIYESVLDGKFYKGSIYDPTLGAELELMLTPIKIGNSGITWSVMLGTTKDFILAEVRVMTIFTIILSIIAIIAASIIVFFALNIAISPITKVTNTLKDISEGEGDLTVKIPEKGKDETTDLARYFNRTLEKIRNLIVVIRNQTVSLSDTGNELAGNMTETAAAINQISANINSINSRVLNQSASLNQSNATMVHITGSIENLNSHIEDQNSNIGKSSAAIEEMVANIKSVTDILVNNHENVKQLSSASENGRRGLETVAENIRDIAKDSEGLLEINALLNNIASQTNLLSMNAAIEAAHAGDAGNGFAVVANEIRKLAEESGTQSKTISIVLKKIKNSIEKISALTGSVMTGFEAIDTNVKIVADQETVMRNSMEEQSNGSRQILDATGLLNEISGRVKDESAEMLGGSREVIAESKNLESVTAEISGGMSEMATGAEQITIAVNKVNEISEKNRENIDLLVKEVSRFKVE